MNWISVKDRLPVVFTDDSLSPNYEISNDILMVDGDGEMAVGNYITFKDDTSPGFTPHGDDVINSHKIVYWMPIPSLPKTNQK